MTTPDETLAHLAKPIERGPQIQHGNPEDAFWHAHANADTDSGSGAIHHSLGRPGGAAEFDHDHGLFTTSDITLMDTVNPTVVGAGGYSTVTYQKIAKRFLFVSFRLKWGGAGLNYGPSKEWLYDWGGPSADKIHPDQDLVVLNGIYWGGPSSIYSGLLVYSGGGVFEWMWNTGTGTMDPIYPGTPTNGDKMVAEGIYQFKDIS